MRIDPEILRKELGKTLNDIDMLIQQVEVMAKEQEIQPYEVPDYSGDGLALVSLMVARAEVLNGLTRINEKGN